MDGAPPPPRPPPFSRAASASSHRSAASGREWDPTAPLPPIAALLRQLSEAGRAGAISSEEKGALKDELISGNWAHVADVMRRITGDESSGITIKEEGAAVTGVPGRGDDACADLNDLMQGLLCQREDDPVVELVHTEEEMAELRQEEVDALVAIYGEDIELLSPDLFRVRCRVLALEGGVDAPADSRLWLCVCLPAQYPDVPPLFEVDSEGFIGWREEEGMCDRLQTEALARLGSPMVYELCTIAQELLEVRMLEAMKAAAALRELRAGKGRKGREIFPRARYDTAEPADSEGPPSTIPDPYGYDYNAYEILYRSQDSDLLRPSRYVGPLSAILQRLPEGYGVVKVENVIAPRTAKAFCDTWEEYRRTCSDPAGREPLTLFHGTHEGHIGSIVSKGLLVPGQGGVQVLNGSAYGVGIYLSPFAEYSLGYTGESYSGSGAVKLLVCAALPGNHATSSHSGFRGMNSWHPNSWAWVFYSARQVLPVYVLHLHSRIFADQAYQTVSAGGLVVSVKGDVLSNKAAASKQSEEELRAEREEKARTAKNASFFIGKRFTVLERAPSDDGDAADVYGGDAVIAAQDGEEDGEYQAFRMGVATAKPHKPRK